MSQSPHRSPSRDDDARAESDRLHLLDSLASQALAQVAGRARGGPDAAVADRLLAAAIGPDPRACGEVARALMAEGVPAERICDAHIPAAAHRMGEAWVNDDLPFSTVTIGSARLQGLLRELDLDFGRRGAPAIGGAGSVLLVVAPGADHTLGALVLASQLRRRAVSVRVALGEAADAMAEAVAASRFDAVFLSATMEECLGHLAQAAQRIRAAVAAPPTFVLGGALLGRAGPGAAGAARDVASVAASAGIDHVTSDLDEAVRLCGLTAVREPTLPPPRIDDPRR